MSFDGEGIDTEGGTVAGVGDSAEEVGGWAFTDLERGDVDAVGWNEFCVRCEVDGGNCVERAEAAAGSRSGDDGEGVTEERAGFADVACGDE